MEIEFITPPVASMPLDHVLVALTEEIDKLDPSLVAHGGLGGQHGYGGHWDTAVFMMRPFCWCESEQCLWCGGCDCPEQAFHYFIDGQEVSYKQYEDFFDRETYAKLSGGKIKTMRQSWDVKKKPYTDEQWHAAADAANVRRTIRHDPVCDFCTRKGIFACEIIGDSPQGKGAPNFWHKPSGLRVWWYKWIGRSMETNGVTVDLASMLVPLSTMDFGRQGRLRASRT